MGRLSTTECTYLPTYHSNQRMEYDIRYPIYIQYIGAYNVALGVICQGRVVTCFSVKVCTTFAVSNHSAWW